MKLLPAFFLLLVAATGSAQTYPTITVKSGTTIKESVPASDLYLYPQFTQGTVFFNTGKHSSAAMNYNRFLDEIQFIAAQGDTLSLANEEHITFVAIGTDSFFYDGGYVKLESQTPAAKLGTKQLLRVIDKEKYGAYGMASPTTAIDNYDSFYDGRKNYDLVIMQDLILARKQRYYIGTAGNRFALATKKNVLELFPSYSKSLKNYFKTNSVAFTSKDDVEKLVQFIGQL